MVFSLCDVGRAGRMPPGDGARPEFSTSSPGIRHEILRASQSNGDPAAPRRRRRRATYTLPTVSGTCSPPSAYFDLAGVVDLACALDSNGERHAPQGSVGADRPDAVGGV